MPSALHDLARMTTATVGAGTITLGSAVSGYLSFAGAGVADGESVSYGITDGPSKEVGVGVYNAALQHLTRVVIASTNGGAPISLSGSAQVYLTPNSENVADKNGTGDQIFAGRVRTPSLIGQLAYGAAAPDSTFLPMDGETPLSQAAYAALYAQVGLEPIFTPTLKGLNAQASNEIAYDGVGTYVAVTTNGADGVFVSKDGGATWQTVSFNRATIEASGGSQAVTYCSGLGLFVVATTNASVFTSPDGLRWTESIVAADAGISFVTCSASRILAVGANDSDSALQYVFTSDDAVTWTRRSLGFTAGTALTACHYSAGLGLWFVGWLGSLATSPDAVTWTHQTGADVSLQGNTVAAFASSGALVVAVGGSCIVSSPDGVTWTNRVAISSFGSWIGVAYGSGAAANQWLAQTGNGFIMGSTNGTAWYTVQNTLGTSFAAIWDGTNYHVAGGAGMLGRSTDLKAWTWIAPPSFTSINGGAYDGTSVRVFVGGTKAWSSTNGTSWTEVSMPGGYVGSLQFVTWVADLSLFVAVGNSSGVFTSPDAVTWTSRTSTMTNPVCVAWSHSLSLAVMVGSNGNLATSPDLVTWTSRTSNTSKDLFSVAWNGTIFCAVGDIGTVITSANGTAWTSRQKPRGISSGTAARKFTWIETDGTSFYAFAANGAVLIGTDGIAWTVYGVHGMISHAHWLNSQLVGAVNGTSGNADIFASTDGKAWALKRQGVLGAQGKLLWDGTKFMWGNTGANGVGGSGLVQGGVSTSTDGALFTGSSGSGVNNTPSPITDICYSPSRHRLLAVGGTGIMYSDDGGATWTRVYGVVSVQSLIASVAYSPSLDLFVILVGGNVGASGVQTFALLSSADGGATWTHRSFASDKLQSVSFAATQGAPAVQSRVIWVASPKNIFVAVGTGGLIVTSPDGAAWTERATPASNQITDVCYNVALGKFAAVTHNGFVYTSTNGTAWTYAGTTQAGGASWGIASLEADGFLATSAATTTQQSSVLVSADAATWYPSSAFVLSIPTQATLQKPFYSSTDSCAVLGSGLFVRSRTDFRVGPFVPLNTDMLPLAGAYDSVNDRYVLGGQRAGLWTLTRAYDKTTQFMLPAKSGTWIKATV